ncbi:MAG: hypothetical protein NVS9B7_18100 [Flavisolibacter sp.]
MKNIVSTLFGCILMFSGCKKDYSKFVNLEVSATPEHLQEIQTKLKGTWAWTFGQLDL